MFWNVIDKNRFEILKKVIETISLKNFYMAGGTALAIQINTRESFDFDFFVRESFNINDLINELNSIGNLQVISSREGTLHCTLNDVQLTFLYFPNDLVEDLVPVSEIPNLYLASIKDIATMKLVAISQRGVKKDFFDLYNICNKFNLSVINILDLLKIKYENNKINYSHIIQSLSYFDDAENEELPRVFIKYDWNTIKNFFVEEQKQIYESV